MQLQTLGKATSLQLGAPEKAERIYYISNAIKLKVAAESSDRKVFKLLKSHEGWAGSWVVVLSNHWGNRKRLKFICQWACSPVNAQ